MAHWLYTVTGHWPFPLDMLRRDQSHAATADDQVLISGLSGEHSGDFGLKQVSVNLIIPDATRWQRPCVARWGSFGWSVSDADDETRRFYREAKERDASRAALRESALAKLTPEERDALLDHRAAA